jgi:hypothetical protein
MLALSQEVTNSFIAVTLSVLAGVALVRFLLGLRR